MKATHKLIASAALALASVVAVPAHAQGFLGGLIDQIVPGFSSTLPPDSLADKDFDDSKAEEFEENLGMGWFCRSHLHGWMFGPGPLAPVGSPCSTPAGAGAIIQGPLEVAKPGDRSQEYGVFGRKGCVVPAMWNLQVPISER